MGLLSGKSETKGWSKRAISYLDKALKGDPEAQFELGMRCLKGIEMPENTKHAIEWLVKSSNQGYEDAQYLLGTCYESGTGVQQNSKIALGFYTQAANAANKYAQFSLGNHFYSQENYDQAVEWYKRSARQEHAPAQFELGRCYYYGIGSVKVEELGYEWLEKAADRNYKPAISLLKKIDNLSNSR